MQKASLHTFIGKYFYRFIPLIAGMLFSLSIKAQDFNYSFAKDSVAWQELNTQTILNTDNSAWNFTYKIPIGFSFNYLGRNFESLTIETNGYIVFDDDRNYALTAFSGFSDRVDSSGNHSVLGYDVSGSANNHVLKIQFKSLGEAGESYLSYQIWLRENGNIIEFHIGPNYFQMSPYDELFAFDTEHYCRIGFVNMNMDTEVCGFFATGNPSSPTFQQATSQNQDPIYLYGIPKQGIFYVFTPSSN